MTSETPEWLKPGVLVKVDMEMHVNVRDKGVLVDRGQYMLVLTNTREVNTWFSNSCLWNEVVIEVFTSSLSAKCSLAC